MEVGDRNVVALVGRAQARDGRAHGDDGELGQ
jgi:hypothetical protein